MKKRTLALLLVLRLSFLPITAAIVAPYVPAPYLAFTTITPNYPFPSSSPTFSASDFVTHLGTVPLTDSENALSGSTFTAKFYYFISQQNSSIYKPGGLSAGVVVPSIWRLLTITKAFTNSKATTSESQSKDRQSPQVEVLPSSPLS